MYEHKKRIYIAGPLNDDAVGYIKNLHNMIQTAEAVRMLGCSVYVPGLDFMQGLVFGNWNYTDYFDNSQAWLEVSDAVFMIAGWAFSSGCKKEHKRALELGIPVCFSIDELKIWLKNDGSEKNLKTI